MLEALASSHEPSDGQWRPSDSCLLFGLAVNLDSLLCFGGPSSLESRVCKGLGLPAQLLGSGGGGGFGTSGIRLSCWALGSHSCKRMRTRCNKPSQPEKAHSADRSAVLAVYTIYHKAEYWLHGPVAVHGSRHAGPSESSWLLKETVSKVLACDLEGSSCLYSVLLGGHALEDCWILSSVSTMPAYACDTLKPGLLLKFRETVATTVNRTGGSQHKGCF